MFTYIRNYGALQGGFLFVAFFASYLLFGNSPDNYSRSEIYGYSMMIISCLAILLATKSFRDQHNKGVISFSQGLKLGLGISTIASALFAIYNWVYLTWLNPSFLSDYQTWHAEQIKQSGLSEAEIETRLAELAQSSQMMENTGFMLFIMFLTVFFIGGLFTLVTAATLKTSSPSPETV